MSNKYYSFIHYLTLVSVKNSRDNGRKYEQSLNEMVIKWRVLVSIWEIYILMNNIQSISSLRAWKIKDCNELEIEIYPENYRVIKLLSFQIYIFLKTYYCLHNINLPGLVKMYPITQEFFRLWLHTPGIMQ